MKLWLLGTGTPTPSVKRMCSGYALELGGDFLIFDHGFGAHHSLLKLGVSPTRVTHVFLSHLHYDHMGDYPRLVLTRWDQGAGKIPDLQVYGPPPLKTISDRLFGEDGVYDPDLVSRTQNACSLEIYRARGGAGERARPQPHVHEVEPGQVIHAQGWQVSVAAVAHFGPHLTSYGFRLDCTSGSFVYSGDTGPCTSMRRLAEDCDVLVHMCHYISGSELGPGMSQSCMGHLELAKLAEEARVKTVVLTHVTEQIDQPGVRERIVAEMARVYRGNIIFGEDGMQIPIKGLRLASLL
jgi:ribonuclease Z